MEIDIWREEVSADVVVVFGDYDGGGQADHTMNTINPSSGYNADANVVVDGTIGGSVSNDHGFGLAHELGHLQGARHEVAIDAGNFPPGTGAPLWGYTHGYVSTTWGFRTIMAYGFAGCNCPLIPFYSSTDFTNVLYLGHHVEDAQANNAQVLNVTDSILASYRPDWLVGTYVSSHFYDDANHNGTWDGCSADHCSISSYGIAGDVPVVDGIGHRGVFRPSTGQWFFDLDASGWYGCDNVHDRCLGPFGGLGDLPVTTPDGHIGIYRPSDAHFYLDRDDNGVWSQSRCVLGPDECKGPWGGPGHRPFIDGSGRIGSFLGLGTGPTAQGLWYLDSNYSGSFEGCGSDTCPGNFGQAGDEPLWTAGGVLGVYRSSTGAFYYDRYSDGSWSGCGFDYCAIFGGPGELAIPNRS